MLINSAQPMARFKVIRSVAQPPQLTFEVQLISGTIPVGQTFSLWDTCHRFDFQVAEVRQEGEMLHLVCTSPYLKGLSPKEKLQDLFASKEVDTEDPKVAQSCSHRRCIAEGLPPKPRLTEYGLVIVSFALVPLHFFVSCQISGLINGLSVVLLLANAVLSCMIPRGVTQRFRPLAFSVLATVVHSLCVH